MEHFQYLGKYATDFCTFDIETSRIDIAGEVQAIPYLWQLCFCGKLCTGRYFESAVKVLNGINGMIEDGKRIIIYVFNLAYEFQFLRSYFDFKSDSVFCLKPRAVLYAVWEHLEFRCAYRLTNMSLKKFTETMEVEHKKLDGDEFNYDVVRYPWTELTERQRQYANNDVLGLYEGINKLLKKYHDTLVTIPLTSTGYVRRDIKKAMRNSVGLLRTCYADLELYALLRKAFRGGDTHASRFYAGIIVDDVYSCDRVSSYIEVMFNYGYPYKLKKYNDVNADLLGSLIKRKYALLFTVKMIDVKIKDDIGSPYIPFAKADICIKPIKDNGRVIEAEVIIMTLTDVDWEIITATYNIKAFEVLTCYVGRYRKLPSALLDEVKRLFIEKCELKGIKDKKGDYILSKERLNSIYGDMVQNMLKDDIIYTGGDDPYELREPDINKYIKNGNKAYKLYQWGVWVTAYARRELYYLAKEIGLDFIYSDTDSIKHTEGHKKELDAYNEWKIKQDLENGAYCDIERDGKIKRYYLGLFEDEGKVDKFITFGAKKYASEDNAGNVSITISGVDKEKGAKEVEKAGGLEALQEGFVFKEGGGANVIYNDETEEKEIEIDGHRLKYASNAVIMPDEYTLHIEPDYERLLTLSRDILKSILSSVGQQIDAEREYNENFNE